jgi:hypothetical protein
MSNIKIKRTSMNLACHLTKKERIEFADALGEASKAVDEAEAVKKSAKKRLDSAKDNHDRLATIVASGIEYRDVEIEERFDLDKGIYTSVRTDTGEITFERPLTDHERQTTFVEAD